MADASAGRTDRQTLTRGRVVAGALDLIDREGTDGLTMRRLGGELGVEAMSLYNHVDSKDDLLTGVVELLWEQVADGLRFGDSWREDVRAFAQAVHQVGYQHPTAYPLMVRRGLLPATAVATIGELLGGLRAAGFGAGAEEALRTVVGYVAGYTLAEVSWYGDPAGADGTPAPERAEVPAGEGAPASGPARHEGSDAAAEAVVRALLDCDLEAQFRFGLEVLLEGLDRVRARQAG